MHADIVRSEKHKRRCHVRKRSHPIPWIPTLSRRRSSSKPPIKTTHTVHTVTQHTHIVSCLPSVSAVCCLSSSPLSESSEHPRRIPSVPRKPADQSLVYEPPGLIPFGTYPTRVHPTHTDIACLSICLFVDLSSTLPKHHTPIHRLSSSTVPPSSSFHSLALKRVYTTPRCLLLHRPR